MVYPELALALILGIFPTAWLSQRFFENPYWGWFFDFLKALGVTIILRNQNDWAGWLGMALIIFGHVFNPMKKFRAFTALPLLMGSMMVLSTYAAGLGVLTYVYAAWIGKPASLRVLAGMAMVIIAHWALRPIQPQFAFLFFGFLMIAHQHEKEMDELLSSYHAE